MAAMKGCLQLTQGQSTENRGSTRDCAKSTAETSRTLSLFDLSSLGAASIRSLSPHPQANGK